MEIESIYVPYSCIHRSHSTIIFYWLRLIFESFFNNCLCRRVITWHRYYANWSSVQFDCAARHYDWAHSDWYLSFCLSLLYMPIDWRNKVKWTFFYNKQKKFVMLIVIVLVFDFNLNFYIFKHRMQHDRISNEFPAHLRWTHFSIFICIFCRCKQLILLHFDNNNK